MTRKTQTAPRGQDVPFVDLVAQYRSIQPEISEAIGGVLSSASFILGPDVSAFESELAAFLGCEFAVGVDSGISALELGLRALDIGPGDEVITAANSFVASASAIAFTGAKPVLVDIDPLTYNINPELVESAITPRTRAIMPVHLYGQPADMDRIMGIARRRGLAVIEDACQAIGSEFKGKRAGAIGDIGTFSFYPAKNLGAYGDGGALVTNDKKIAERVRMLRNYGQREKYHHVYLAYNRRLDSIQAAVLRVKLRHLGAWNTARREHARSYRNLLAEGPIAPPVEAPGALHTYHLYVVRVRERERVQAAIAAAGVSTGVHYPIPIHLQEAMSDLGHKVGDFPQTEAAAKEILSLPMFPELTGRQIERVVESLLAATR